MRRTPVLSISGELGVRIPIKEGYVQFWQAKGSKILRLAAIRWNVDTYQSECKLRLNIARQIICNVEQANVKGITKFTPRESEASRKTAAVSIQLLHNAHTRIAANALCKVESWMDGKVCQTQIIPAHTRYSNMSVDSAILTPVWQLDEADWNRSIETLTS